MATGIPLDNSDLFPHTESCAKSEDIISSPEWAISTMESAPVTTPWRMPRDEIVHEMCGLHESDTRMTHDEPFNVCLPRIPLSEQGLEVILILAK